ncbi:MAG: hypothetical protein MN733_13530 [Nitrososphaera sp.]|nr:hypothetical protein [Nitrososphaera sp.]
MKHIKYLWETIQGKTIAGIAIEKDGKYKLELPHCVLEGEEIHVVIQSAAYNEGGWFDVECNLPVSHKDAITALIKKAETNMELGYALVEYCEDSGFILK